MKKVLLGLTFLSFLLLPFVGFAAAPTQTAPDIDVMKSLANITNWAFALLIVIAGLMLIFAAFNFITAQGDPEQVKKARDYVLYALIGVVIAFLAKGLVAMIEKIVTPPV